jgi:hypothetical protein
VALAVWFALTALVPPAFTAPVEVVPATPDVACPDQVAVEKALLAQIGNGAPARGWRLTYRSTDHTAAGIRVRRGALRLDLADDRGKSRLQRQLRVEGGDCRARAEAIALIVYRFFTELGGTGSESFALSPPPVRALPSSPPPASPPPPIPPTRASPPPPATPPPVTTSARASPPSPPAPPARLRLSLEAGGGLWTRRPGTATSVFGLRLARRNIEAAFSVLAPRAPAAQRPADGGEVEVSALGMAISLGLVWEGARLRLHGGPMSIVSRESARSRGIAIPAENAGTTAALGLAAGASWDLRGGFRLGFEAGLGHAVLGNRFVVGGWGRVLPPPPWQGVVLARLGYTFSP